MMHESTGHVLIGKAPSFALQKILYTPLIKLYV